MPAPQTPTPSLERIGRYLISEPIAAGGMATVHFGALVGEAGFSRIVAVKRLHTGKRSRTMASGLLDEARLVSRVKHPSVVPTLDVVAAGGEMLVVLEYVVGESLSRLLRACDGDAELVPISFAATIMSSVLHGLDAAHDAKSAHGRPLAIVHRDVSPQNIMVGCDGLARVLDFGIAKATERLGRSRAGQVKGKLAYMAPEQLAGKADRRVDVYAASVVLWELLTCRRLFGASTQGDIMQKKIAHEVVPPSTFRAEVSSALDDIVMKGLSKRPDDRFDTARQMALAIEACTAPARASAIGAWVEELAGPALARRSDLVLALEAIAVEQSGDAPSLALPSSDAASLMEEMTEDVVSSELETEPKTARVDTGDGTTAAPISERTRDLRAGVQAETAETGITDVTAVTDVAAASALTAAGQGATDGVTSAGEATRVSNREPAHEAALQRQVARTLESGGASDAAKQARQLAASTLVSADLESATEAGPTSGVAAVSSLAAEAPDSVVTIGPPMLSSSRVSRVALAALVAAALAVIAVSWLRMTEESGDAAKSPAARGSSVQVAGPTGEPQTQPSADSADWQEPAPLPPTSSQAQPASAKTGGSEPAIRTPAPGASPPSSAPATLRPLPHTPPPNIQPPNIQPPHTQPPTPLSPNCNPAFTVDERGIRHPKPECM